MRSLRVWIKKEGRAKYISHLDMNRCFMRAVRRANLNLWYTEGFNPHPYLNFLTPLSLGQESEAEPLDIKVEGDMTDGEIQKRLSAVMPEGITITGVREPVCPASDIAAAEYDVLLEFSDDESASRFAGESRRIVASGVLTAEKQGKKGGRKTVKEVNVCDGILSFEASADGKEVHIKATLAAGNTSSLNSSLLLSALEAKTELSPEYVNIRRLRLLKADGTDFR
jgi:radical SAM-linked protein